MGDADDHYFSRRGRTGSWAKRQDLLFTLHIIERAPPSALVFLLSSDRRHARGQDADEGLRRKARSCV